MGNNLFVSQCIESVEEEAMLIRNTCDVSVSTKCLSREIHKVCTIPMQAYNKGLVSIPVIWKSRKCEQSIKTELQSAEQQKNVHGLQWALHSTPLFSSTFKTTFCL